MITTYLAFLAVLAGLLLGAMFVILVETAIAERAQRKAAARRYLTYGL